MNSRYASDSFSVIFCYLYLYMDFVNLSFSQMSHECLNWMMPCGVLIAARVNNVNSAKISRLIRTPDIMGLQSCCRVECVLHFLKYFIGFIKCIYSVINRNGGSCFTITIRKTANFLKNKLTDEQKPNCTLTSLGTPVGLLVNRDIVGVRQVPGWVSDRLIYWDYSGRPPLRWK